MNNFSEQDRMTDAKVPWMCCTPGCINTRLSTSTRCMSCIQNAAKAERAAMKAASKPAPAPLKRAPVKKVSDKKRKDLVLYAPLKAQFLLDKPHCEFNFKDCTKKAIEPHHTSTSERDFLNVETWISTCRSCHMKVEAMPAETRRELGYLIDSPTEEKRTI